MAPAANSPQTADQRPQTAKPHAYPAWSPRFWHGMRFGDWFKLLAENGFAVHPFRAPMACAITCFTAANSVMAWTQKLFYGGKIARTQIEQPPVFIIGHWRSGTTHLHELLVRDERFCFPNTYECFSPSHFLVSDRMLSWVIGALMPRKRPMDNMRMGVAHPQEDEFALSNLGCPTPYWRIAFPNRPPCHLDLLNTLDAPPEKLDRWKQHLLNFSKALTYRKQKRLVMKSPPHTGRIQTLAELFPGARFVHITRDPFAIFASTRRLWESLYQVQGLQIPRFEDQDEYIFQCFERMYEGFEQQRHALDENQLHEVRYEDVVQDPIGQLETIYQKLDLGDFEEVRADVQAYVGDQKDYKPNQHKLEQSIQDQIRQRWAYYFERYGYE